MPSIKDTQGLVEEMVFIGAASVCSYRRDGDAVLKVNFVGGKLT